ncbi:MAG TPA: O-antigen ligase family protein [Bryobacteraceae bacterium]|nr:O-antigen ligase family protein [Bryobacteraceae bacterium]
MLSLGLEGLIPIVLYIGFIAVVIMTVFWRPIIGIYFLVPLLPAQSFRDRLNAFPLGASMVTILVLAVAIGLKIKGRPVFTWSTLRTPLFVYIGYTFVSLCAGSFYLGHSVPLSPSDPRVGNWRNYITMLLLLFVVSAAVTTTREIRILLALMCVSVFFFDRSFWGTASQRDYSSYSEELHDADAGPVGYAGVNGLAAFEAQVSIAFLSLAAFERKRLLKFAYIGLAGYSALCLMYSLSRGGYLAFLVGWLFLGMLKYRKLLLLFAVFAVTWTAVVPNAVRERVDMTRDNDGDLDHSSEVRVDLWEDAMQTFSTNPVTGTGFDTYAYMQHMSNYRDTHNMFVKVLVETGIVGMALFLWLLFGCIRAGFRLFRAAADPTHAAIGLALAMWVICSIAANCFGDRWTYLQVNGFLWVFAGFAARAWSLEHQAEAEPAAAEVMPETLCEA